jgi:hypothetical protein
MRSPPARTRFAIIITAYTGERERVPVLDHHQAGDPRSPRAAAVDLLGKYAKARRLGRRAFAD